MWYYYVLCMVVWIAYSLFEGYREAYYYNNTYTSEVSEKRNMHPSFDAQRLLVMGLFISGNFCADGVMVLLSMSLVFSFFHDGMYYATRNNINSNMYIRRWMSNSSQSNASFEITFTGRLILLFLGFLVLSYTIFNLWGI
jgi:hypothetical protein